MPTNTKTEYVEIGTAVTLVSGVYVFTNSLQLPAPHILPVGNKLTLAADTTAAGTIVAQQIGRTKYQATFTWSLLKNREYWSINRWFRDHGYAFFMRYFNHNEGAVKIQRFYRDDAAEAKPSEVQEIIGTLSVPAYYRDFGFRVRDIGETVITESEVTIS